MLQIIKSKTMLHECQMSVKKYKTATEGTVGKAVENFITSTVALWKVFTSHIFERTRGQVSSEWWRERERENSQLSVKIVTFDLVSKVHVQSHMLASKGQTQVMDYLQIPGIHIAKGGWYNHMIGKDPPSYVCWLIRTKHWQYPSLLF